MTIQEKVLIALQGKDGKEFMSHELVEIVKARFSDVNRGNFQPSDFCYNMTNKGIGLDFPFPLFEYTTSGLYKFLGRDYPYTGKVLWKDMLLGEWLNGTYRQIANTNDL